MQSKTLKFSQLKMLNTNHFSSDKKKKNKREDNQTKNKSEMQCKLQSQLKYQWGNQHAKRKQKGFIMTIFYI